MQDNNLTEEILKRADIVKIISSFLSVSKKGKNYVALCPFHDDSNPSMVISPEKKMFKCFVCGTGGNAITFVQKYLHISFFEARKKVAEMIGFNDPRLEDGTYTKAKVIDEKRETMLKCLHDLCLYYEYSLNTQEGKAGLEYFENRHLDKELRDKFKLGYAFQDGFATVRFLTERGHSLKTIEDVGVSALLNGSYFDKNQGRVIFPIADAEGSIIGFSARKIKEGPEAKYVNSPETYVFHKSSVLYNYHIAKEKAKIANCVYVLEGFMDVFALSKIGMDNAVAIMGTALTNEHIQMLRALNVEIRLCLDGDLPGQSAMMKAAKVLENAGLKFVLIDNQNSSKDPDEILNSDGPDALRAYLNRTLNRVDFALQYYKNSNPLKSSDQKKQLVYEFIPILLSIRSQLEFDNYLRKLSAVTGYDVESLRDLIKRAREVQKEDSTGKGEALVMANFHPERKILRRLNYAEREFLYQMATNPDAVRYYDQKEIGFYDEIYRSLANFLIEYVASHNDYEPNDIISTIEESEIENKDELINEFTNLYFEKNHPNECSKELLENLVDSMNQEKDNIFENDMLSQSLEGKSELEKARIIAEYNRRKMRKNTK